MQSQSSSGLPTGAVEPVGPEPGRTPQPGPAGPRTPDPVDDSGIAGPDRPGSAPAFSPGRPLDPGTQI